MTEDFAGTYGVFIALQLLFDVILLVWFALVLHQLRVLTDQNKNIWRGMKRILQRIKDLEHEKKDDTREQAGE